MEFERGIVGDDLALTDDEDDATFQPAVQAYKLDLQLQQTLTLDKEALSYFNGFLSDLLIKLQPSQNDYQARVDILVRLANFISRMDLKGANIDTFGSFESNLYSRWADLDVALQLPDHLLEVEPMGKALKVKVLRNLSKTLKRGAAHDVHFVAHARVPVITFRDPFCNISCDISIDNGIAVLKSRVLRWIGEVDPRCRNLILLVKCWAKAHCINDPKSGTLNSFALCLLVVFHLQTRSPPVLPPLNAFLDEDIAQKLEKRGSTRAFREQLLCRVWERIQPFIINKFGAQNRSSLAELFISFFTQFSAVTKFWVQGLAVCTFTGKWGDSTCTSRQWRRKNYLMAIEDPFDRKENCGRSVQGSSFDDILNAFSLAASAFHEPFDDVGFSALLEDLFRWPKDAQTKGLQLWLSNVHINYEKAKHTPYGRRQPVFFGDVFEAQFTKQLMVSKSRSSLKKMTGNNGGAVQATSNRRQSYLHTGGTGNPAHQKGKGYMVAPIRHAQTVKNSTGFDLSVSPNSCAHMPSQSQSLNIDNLERHIGDDGSFTPKNTRKGFDDQLYGNARQQHQGGKRWYKPKEEPTTDALTATLHYQSRRTATPTILDHKNHKFNQRGQICAQRNPK